MRFAPCCLLLFIKHWPLRLNNHFVAQSLYFHFGSSAPYPTLKPYVAASAPRTRYRLLVRLYLVGFPHYISTAGWWETGNTTTHRNVNSYYNSNYNSDCEYQNPYEDEFSQEVLYDEWYTTFFKNDRMSSLSRKKYHARTFLISPPWTSAHFLRHGCIILLNYDWFFAIFIQNHSRLGTNSPI